MTKKQALFIAIPSILVILLSVLAVFLVVFDSDERPAGNDVVTESTADTTSSEQTSDTTTSSEEQSTSDSTVVTSDDETTTEEDTTTEEITTTTTPATSTTKKQEPTEETTTENPTKFIDADISAFVNEWGSTIKTRFKTPDGFERVSYESGSFSDTIQNLPLKSHGSKIYVYDGTEKENQTWHAAVINIELTSNGWLQCADCVIKLISDYLYDNGRYGDITFTLSSGLEVPYSKWASGYRIILNSSETKAWLEKTAAEDTGRNTYLRYLNNIYLYANTRSLQDQDESKQLDINNVFPGAYFIVGPNYSLDLTLGHAIMVVDVAKNPRTGEVAFLLAQGNTPSENMHVILNPLHPDDPWYYTSEIGDTFFIPFREFITEDLYYYGPISIPKVIN